MKFTKVLVTLALAITLFSCTKERRSIPYLDTESVELVNIGFWEETQNYIRYITKQHTTIHNYSQDTIWYLDINDHNQWENMLLSDLDSLIKISTDYRYPPLGYIAPVGILGGTSYSEYSYAATRDTNGNPITYCYKEYLNDSTAILGIRRTAILR